MCRRHLVSLARCRCIWKMSTVPMSCQACYWTKNQRNKKEYSHFAVCTQLPNILVPGCSSLSVLSFSIVQHPPFLGAAPTAGSSRTLYIQSLTLAINRTSVELSVHNPPTPASKEYPSFVTENNSSPVTFFPPPRLHASWRSVVAFHFRFSSPLLASLSSRLFQFPFEDIFFLTLVSSSLPPLLPGEAILQDVKPFVDCPA